MKAEKTKAEIKSCSASSTRTVTPTPAELQKSFEETVVVRRDVRESLEEVRVLRDTNLHVLLK